jgi:YbbR domain-containing protein
LTLTVRAQTTAERAEDPDTASAQVRVDLDGLSAAVHRVSIEVTLADPRAQVLPVYPPAVDVTLEPIATRTLTPGAETVDLASLPPRFAVGDFQLSLETATARGVSSSVNEVAEATARVTLSGRRNDFPQMLEVLLLDAQGRQVAAMSKNPEEILALISIRRTFSTREIEVQVNVQLSGPQQLITQVDRQLGFVSVTLNPAGYETGLHRVRLETEAP